MTKAAMARLVQSEFFHEVCEIVVAREYYLHMNNWKAANECMHKWCMAQLALKHITGEQYGFSSNGKFISLINERNCDDIIFRTKVHRH